jgi:uncharacterized coiled-coil protein SlyX
MSNEQKLTPIQSLKENWFIIVFFMGMAVTWGSFSQKDKVQEARIEILEAKVEKIDDGLAGVNEKLVEISTSLGYIQKAVDELAAE